MTMNTLQGRDTIKACHFTDPHPRHRHLEKPPHNSTVQSTGLDVSPSCFHLSSFSQDQTYTNAWSRIGQLHVCACKPRLWFCDTNQEALQQLKSHTQTCGFDLRSLHLGRCDCHLLLLTPNWSCRSLRERERGRDPYSTRDILIALEANIFVRPSMQSLTTLRLHGVRCITIKYRACFCESKR